MSKPIILLFTFLLLACNEDDKDSLALRNKVKTEIDSLEFVAQAKKATLDSIEREDALADACDSSCEIRKKKFESSIIEFTFKSTGTQSCRLEVVKTTTGAGIFIFCPGRGGRSELSVEEWQNLVNVLFKYCINNNKWENYRSGEPMNYDKGPLLWTLEILSSNKNKKIDTLKFERHRKESSPPHWEKVDKVIDDISEKVKIRKIGE